MLKFESDYLREVFHLKLSAYLQTINVKEDLNKTWTFKNASEEAVTKEKRQMQLEMFFRVVFAQVNISML